MEENQQKLPERQDISEQYKWKLEDLYASDDEWEKEFKQIQQLIPQIEAYQGKLAQSDDQLLTCLKLQDDISKLMERVFVYARMRRDEDNRRGVYQGLTDKAGSLSTEVNRATSFIVPEILAIPEEKLKTFIDQNKDLHVYRHYIDEILRMKDHILPPEQEQLLAQVGEVSRAPQTIYTMINNADMTFPAIQDENGNEVEVTHGRYIQLMESKSRRVRKAAFEALYSSYEKQVNTIASTLNSSIKKDVFYARVRKYPSALEASLDEDNVPIDVYHNLIKTVHDNLDSMYEYVSLRKQILGLDELHMYDLYTPLVSDVDIKYPYEEAKNLVLNGLKPLGEDYQNVLQESFQNGWIDVFETKGKTSGAYSWGAYGTHPYVLMNYQPNIDNVFTLAHELGHALHSYYSDKHQPYIYAQYTIFVAEVASTVNESLLMAHLLKNMTDKKKRMYLLNHYLEQFRGTVYRQTMFAEFEKMTHEKVEAGEALTPDLLKEMYRDLNIKYYGPEMVIDSQIDVEWARIPHFYTPFYVYKYATGFSAATALSRKILEEGEEAVNRYLTFLKSGSSDYPIELLKTAGVDMSSPEPVQQALDVFREMVGELKALIQE